MYSQSDYTNYRYVFYYSILLISFFFSGMHCTICIKSQSVSNVYPDIFIKILEKRFKFGRTLNQITIIHLALNIKKKIS